MVCSVLVRLTQNERFHNSTLRRGQSTNLVRHRGLRIRVDWSHNSMYDMINLKTADPGCLPSEDYSLALDCELERALLD